MRLALTQKLHIFRASLEPAILSAGYPVPPCDALAGIRGAFVDDIAVHDAALNVELARERSGQHASDRKSDKGALHVQEQETAVVQIHACVIGPSDPGCTGQGGVSYHGVHGDIDDVSGFWRSDPEDSSLASDDPL
jgi:hypothetical protein